MDGRDYTTVVELNYKVAYILDGKDYTTVVELNYKVAYILDGNDYTTVVELNYKVAYILDGNDYTTVVEINYKVASWEIKSCVTELGRDFFLTIRNEISSYPYHFRIYSICVPNPVSVDWATQWCYTTDLHAVVSPPPCTVAMGTTW